MRKDDAEREDLREAARLSDAVSEPVRGLGEGIIGRTEAELATEVRLRLYEASTEGPSFEPVAAAGPNGARPHHRHGDRVIEAGDPVVLDFGACRDGYTGDQTRTTVFAGEPSDDFVEAHGIVRDALETGVDTVEPCIEAQAVDRAARGASRPAATATSSSSADWHGECFLCYTEHGMASSELTGEHSVLTP